jgi:hypothetical protein
VLSHHRLLSASDAADASAGALQHIKAVASSSLVLERSGNRCRVGGGGSGVGSPAGAVSSDSCALRDCAPMPNRRSALPNVSS